MFLELACITERLRLLRGDKLAIFGERSKRDTIKCNEWKLKIYVYIYLVRTT